MNKTALLAAVLVFGISFPVEAMPSAQSKPNDPATKVSEQVFENVQVLKGIPESEFYDTMNFIAASLGVQCTFCHFENAYQKDDKKPKQTARQMIRMQLAINRENFGGRAEVTCFSCHRGTQEPVGIPIVAGEAKRAQDEAAAKSNLPAASDVLKKYIQALGGAESWQGITSLVAKGTLGSRKMPIEYFIKIPDKKMSVMHLPSGDNITSFDGTIGWFQPPGEPPAKLDPGNNEILRLDSELTFPLRMNEMFSQFIVRPPEKIQDRAVTVLDATKPGQSRVRLYFDDPSGLLLRMVRYLETPLGLLPTEIDYDDYRDMGGGAKFPMRQTVARPGNPGFTVQIEQVQKNVPIDDGKFTMPSSPAK